jgi:hypothetical protein
MMKSGDLQTVLKHKARKLFPVHQLTVNKSELKSWNICALFASTEPSSRGPAPKTLDCTYMAIDFEKTEKPDRFDQSLLNVLTQRLRHQEDFRNGREVARKESQKPSRWLSVESNKESFTGLTAVSSASSVPVLPQIAKTVSLSLVDIDEDTEPTSPASSGRADSKLFKLKEFGGK